MVGGTLTSSAPTLVHHRQHLLDEERIALGRRADSPAEADVEGKTVEQSVDQLVRLLGRERLEQHARGVELAAAPAGHPVEQLGSGEAEEQDRRVPAQVGDLLDEVEERGLAPMEIVQEDDQRSFDRPRLEQLAHAEGDLVGRRLPVAEQGVDGGIVRRLGAEELLDDLDRGPVGNPLAVGQAASADDRCVDRCEELLRQARLADARRPEDREQGASPLREHALPGAGEQPRLALTADERCVEAAGCAPPRR